MKLPPFTRVFVVDVESTRGFVGGGDFLGFGFSFLGLGVGLRGLSVVTFSFLFVWTDIGPCTVL